MAEEPKPDFVATFAFAFAPVPSVTAEEAELRLSELDFDLGCIALTCLSTVSVRPCTLTSIRYASSDVMKISKQTLCDGQQLNDADYHYRRVLIFLIPQTTLFDDDHTTHLSYEFEYDRSMKKSCS